jgi:dihydroflavonol-4-reductase
MSTQVLVTGGTGFIGRFLVRRMLQEGIGVRLFCRSQAKARALFDHRVELFEGDLLNAERVHSACRGVRSVIHVGGAYCFGSGRKKQLFNVNAGGTRHVMEAAWRQNVEKVVHVSTGSLFNVEHSNALPWGSHYKRSKWMAERCAMDWAERGLPVTVASPSSPVGPEDETPTPTGRMVLDFLNGRFPFVSRTGLNFISVLDCADGILAVAERGKPGVKYLIGDRNLWLAEFLALVARFAKRPAPSRTLPWPIIAAAGLAGEIAGWVSPKLGQRVCWETAYFARKVQFFNSSRTRAELGWAPRESLESAVRGAVDWYCKHRMAAPLPAAKVTLEDAVAS